MWILCSCFFAKFPQFGGIEVVDEAVGFADFALDPIFSITVFCGWVFGEEDASIGACLRVKHEQGAE